MSRRDMIIVAVLMNVGVLAVLFLMAVQTDEPQVQRTEVPAKEVVAKTLPILEEKPVVILPKPPSMGHASQHDELDSVLKAYAQNTPVAQAVGGERSHIESAPPPVVEVQPFKQKEVAVSKSKEDSVGFVEIKVKRGDSLDKIARANNTTVKAIKRANDLNTDRLQIGQVLKIPLSTKKSDATVKSVIPAQASVQSYEYYTLKNGDNPWKIAKMFQVRFDKLLELNNLDEEKARRLKAGDRIRVR